MQLHNRTAVVTGAGSGIGLATAAELARRGMNVVVADLDDNRAQRAADALRAQGAATDCSRLRRRQ